MPFYCLLSIAFLFLVVPSFFAMSSCHLLLGHPLDFFPLLGCLSVQRLVNLLSFILAICPAHFHFTFSVCPIMSVIFILFLISEHVAIFCSFKFNIFFSPLLFEQFLLCQLFIERQDLNAVSLALRTDVLTIETAWTQYDA